MRFGYKIFLNKLASVSGLDGFALSALSVSTVHASVCPGFPDKFDGLCALFHDLDQAHMRLSVDVGPWMIP